MIEHANIIRVTKEVELDNNPDIEVRPITEENINDGLSFNSQKDIESFREFLKIGHKGYYGYYKGNCGIRTWIFKSEDRCIVGQNFSYVLPKDEAFAAWAKTNIEYRKKGLFTSALKFAILDNKDKVISAYVESKNIGSLKGTEKAGFETLEKYILISFWKFHLKIKTYQINKKNCFSISLGRKIKALEK